ncbi:rCG29531 [Rattus norvegicus]|uniref:RCG29531 n=1 Tax=Rattus norvegicus TaxID=10116 RepID=A6K8Z9_RAT|nr:rCG29531 [Rattus norvegicus]
MGCATSQGERSVLQSIMLEGCAAIKVL